MLKTKSLTNTEIMRGAPSYDLLSSLTKDYNKVVVFVDFNNVARGIYYDDMAAMILTYMITYQGNIPSILIQDWMKYQIYFEQWAKYTQKTIFCLYYSESGVSYYHSNLYSKYKAGRKQSSFRIPDSILPHFQYDREQAAEAIKYFIQTSWKWIETMAVKSHIGAMRLHNLDADFIPEYMLRKGNMYRDDTYYIIITSDGDMIQTLDYADNISIVNNEDVTTYENWHKSKKYLLNFSQDNVEETETFPPDRIIMYKAIAGDISDGLPGIRGLGGKSLFKNVFREIPEDVRTDDLTRMKDVLKTKVGENSTIKKIYNSWDQYVLGVKLVSFFHLIEHLCGVPSRLDEMRSLIQKYDMTNLDESSNLINLYRQSAGGLLND